MAAFASNRLSINGWLLSVETSGGSYCACSLAADVGLRLEDICKEGRQHRWAFQAAWGDQVAQDCPGRECLQPTSTAGHRAGAAKIYIVTNVIGASLR